MPVGTKTVEAAEVGTRAHRAAFDLGEDVAGAGFGVVGHDAAVRAPLNAVHLRSAPTPPGTPGDAQATPRAGELDPDGAGRHGEADHLAIEGCGFGGEGGVIGISPDVRFHEPEH
jgi:hypothetical protein